MANIRKYFISLPLIIFMIMRRIVIAFDSFKGSLTSREAGEAFVRGFSEIMDVDARLVSIADGGEGMAEAVVESVGGELVTATVHDPIGRIIEACYAIIDGGSRAVIAMSAASGLTLVEAEMRDPAVATTYGVGELILDAYGRGCRNVVVGLGGSATNDGGVGMLRALGYRFYDAQGAELCATLDILERVHTISDNEAVALDGLSVVAATDVDNPLCGLRGATHVFGRQKGADEALVECLERAMCHYAEVVDARCGYTASSVPGAGAAGGLGYAMTALLGVPLCSGIDMVLDIAHFDDVVRGSDLVVTGEGRIDAQTLMGKAPAGVLRRARQWGVPCVAVGGGVAWDALPEDSGFAAIFSATPEGMALSEAMRYDVATQNLISVGRKTALWLLAQ